MQINSSEALGSSSNVNKKSLESQVAEIEAGTTQAVAIKVVLVDQINDKIEEETIQVILTSEVLSENKNLNQQQPDLESKLSDHEEDIGTLDNKSEDHDGKVVPNTKEEPENGSDSDDKVEDLGENSNSAVITEDEEIQMQKENEDSLENLTENVAKVELEEEESPECDQANLDNQIPAKEEEKEEKENKENAEEMMEEQESYPQDLNPFGSDNETKESSTNPFGSESDSESVGDQEPTAAKEEAEIKQTTELPPPKPPRLSLNPFGSDFEDGSDDDEVKPGSDEEIKKKARKKRPAPLPPSAVSKVTPTTPQPAPRISLRPPPRYF